MQYDVGRLAEEGYLDTITWIKSIKIKSINIKDDRMEMAIDERMEGITRALRRALHGTRSREI